MIKRALSDAVQQDMETFPVIGVLGPRQSGKTTLVRTLFPGMRYLNLEDPETRAFAEEDPRGLLQDMDRGVILDEFQRVPELLSHVQVLSDEDGRPGRFLLTGSQNYLMMEKISQSLAGRISLFTLYPLSLQELAASGASMEDSRMLQYRGFFPRIEDAGTDPTRFHAAYIQTYLERDVRQLKQISDLSQFSTFLRLCAGRVGQVVNLSSLGDDVGISHNTVKSWLALLEAAHIVYPLRPYYRNFNKQIIKTSRLYFTDTGLLCSLLGIHNPEMLAGHYAVGGVFENFVLMEVVKWFANRGLPVPCHFWRDRRGHEVDLLIDQGQQRIAVEIKAGQTISGTWFRNLSYYGDLDQECPPANRFLLYGGDRDQNRSGGTVLPWTTLVDPGTAFRLR